MSPRGGGVASGQYRGGGVASGQYRGGGVASGQYRGGGGASGQYAARPGGASGTRALLRSGKDLSVWGLVNLSTRRFPD
jgi:hypothetical protein